MSQLTEDQLNDIVEMTFDDYGSRLTGGEVSEVIGLILENISGFETVESQTLTQTINEIRKRYDFRYDDRAHTNRGLRNRVIYVIKSPFKDSTLD